MYPESVELKDPQVKKLITTIQESYKVIVSQIEGATNFGVANRKQILAQIDQELENLGVDVNEFLKTELPEYYKQGARDAVLQLQHIGADIAVADGFNKVHLEAIKALVSDSARSFADAMQGVSRSAQGLLSDQVKAEITQKLATGMTQGSALKTVTKDIKRTLQNEGLSALKDKRGATWSLDRYAEMLFRTKAVEARNSGMINRLVQNGYDLAQVSDHNTSCQLCGPWEGEIISVNGENNDYPSLGDAEADGLFHPNCRHAINVISDLSEQTQAYNIDTGDYEEGGGLPA